MMKRTLAGVILSVAAVSAHAEAPGGPDCGWGNMIFDGQSGLPAHFFASWTNGTTGNATFGMTSGTNGCSHNGTITYGGQKWLGMASIMDEFSEDVARGEGDALKAVAVSMGIEQGDRAHFAKVLHENFDNIFTSSSVTAQEVVENIESVMSQDEQLKKYAA